MFIMVNKRKASKKQQQQTMIFAGLAIFLIVGGFFGGRALGWWGATTAVEEEMDFIFYVENLRTGEEVDADDHGIYLYDCDVSEMDAEEIEDLDFTNFAIEKSDLDSGDDFEPDEDNIYWAMLNGSDICEYWFIPQLGLNHLYATNMTEDVAMTMYSEDELDYDFSSTLAGNHYDEWIIRTLCLDGAEGTGDKTSVEGYMPHYDFETDEWETVVLTLTWNTTGELDFCDFESGYEYTEKVSGNTTVYEIKAGIFGESEFKIDLGSGYGSDFESVNATIGYGTAESSTTWDSYAP